MRYFQLRSFEKHLKSAAPDHLSRLYLVAWGEEEERRELILSMLPLFSGVSRRFEGEGLDELLSWFTEPSLFREEKVLWIDRCETLSKKEQERVGQLIDSLPPEGSLLLGIKGKSPWIQKVDQGGVVFDLSDEKPWDRDRRLAEMIADYALSLGKQIGQEAVFFCIERVGKQGSFLKREVEKLSLFVGNRPQIEKKDVALCSSTYSNESIWQSGERIVWEGDVPLEGDSFYPLLPSLRSQLVLGVKICSLIERKIPFETWSSHLPKIWPKTLAKRKEQAACLGQEFFQEGLDLLFSLELSSRGGASSEGAMLDFLRLFFASRRRK